MSLNAYFLQLEEKYNWSHMEHVLIDAGFTSSILKFSE